MCIRHTSTQSGWRHYTKKGNEPASDWISSYPNAQTHACCSWISHMISNQGFGSTVICWYGLCLYNFMWKLLLFTIRYTLPDTIYYVGYIMNIRTVCMEYATLRNPSSYNTSYIFRFFSKAILRIISTQT